MKCEIIFIQGAGTETVAMEEPMVGALHEQLGADFHIRHPPMPEADAPDYSLWKEKIEREINAATGPVIFLGHSLGGSILLKYFTEMPIPEQVIGLILFGMPFWGAAHWKYPDFELDPDKAGRLKMLKGIYLYHSEADEEVPFAHLELYRQLLPEAQSRAFSSLDHSYSGAVEDMAGDIAELRKGIT